MGERMWVPYAHQNVSGTNLHLADGYVGRPQDFKRLFLGSRQLGGAPAAGHYQSQDADQTDGSDGRDIAGEDDGQYARSDDHGQSHQPGRYIPLAKPQVQGSNERGNLLPR